MPTIAARSFTGWPARLTAVGIVACILAGQPFIREQVALWLLAADDGGVQPASPASQTAKPPSHPTMPTPRSPTLRFAADGDQVPLGAGAYGDDVETGNYQALILAAEQAMRLSGVSGVELVWTGTDDCPQGQTCAPGRLDRRAAAATAALRDMVDRRFAVPPVIRIADKAVPAAGASTDALVLTIRAAAASNPGCADPIELRDPTLPGSDVDPHRPAGLLLAPGDVFRASPDSLWRIGDGAYRSLGSDPPLHQCDTHLQSF